MLFFNQSKKMKIKCKECQTLIWRDIKRSGLCRSCSHIGRRNIIFEVKGWKSSRDIKKMDAVMRGHVNIPIVIVDKPMLCKIEKGELFIRDYLL